MNPYFNLDLQETDGMIDGHALQPHMDSVDNLFWLTTFDYDIV